MVICHARSNVTSLNLSLKKKGQNTTKKSQSCVKIVKLPIKQLLVFFFARKELSIPYQIRSSSSSDIERIWYGPDNPCLAKKILIKDEVLLTVSCPIYPSILIAKNLLTGSLKNRSIDNLETQKKSISMKNSQFFDYLL